MSQKNALPRARAMTESLTKSPRFGGAGTGCARRSPGRLPRSSGGFCTRAKAGSHGSAAKTIAAVPIRTAEANKAVTLPADRMLPPMNAVRQRLPGTRVTPTSLASLFSSLCSRVGWCFVVAVPEPFVDDDLGRQALRGYAERQWDAVGKRRHSRFASRPMRTHRLLLEVGAEIRGNGDGLHRA